MIFGSLISFANTRMAEARKECASREKKASYVVIGDAV
jgi:hypothetical protein